MNKNFGIENTQSQNQEYIINTILNDSYNKDICKEELPNSTGFDYSSVINTPKFNQKIHPGVKHQPLKMNFVPEKNFPSKPKKTFLNEKNNSSVEHINLINDDEIKIPKNKHFIPWKRADLDPSLVKKGTEIHINPLPPDATHQELYNIFKDYGEVIDIRLIPRKEKNNCFAFIRFMEPESVGKVMADKDLKYNVHI
jgi:hypothetical protein